MTRIRLLMAFVVVAAGLVVVGSGASAIEQNGTNNYAGPKTCAAASAAFGVDFAGNCTTDTTVTQNSNGGLNVFELTLNGPGGTVVQNNSAAGTNKAFCVLDQSVNGPNTTTNQLCDVTQNTGTNTTVVDVKASHSYSDTLGLQQLSQDASVTVKIAQTSVDNDNTVNGVGGGAALLRTNQTLNSDVQIAQQQRQERLILLDVDQIATGSGDNATDFNIDTDQSGVARGRSPDQGQDIRANGASDPNAKAYIYQRTATGTNNTKGRGTDEKRLEATSIDSALGGAATQKQWHAAGGFDIVADVDSSGNPGGGTVDFGTPYAEGTDCLLVDGFRKLGTIETYSQTPPLARQTTTAGVRVQDDGLPIGIPGLSPKTVTTATCSKLDAPSGTTQRANLSVKGHAKEAIVGAMSARTKGASTYTDFDDQTVNEVIGCTETSCTTTQGGVTGSGIDITANEDEAFTKDVASFTNASPSNAVTSASINWGDTTSSAGTINGSGPYTVRGTHTYAEPGTYTVTTTVTTQDSSTATFTSTATVNDVIDGENIAGGAFVIGDKSTNFSSGSTVTFWSQSWATFNPTTTGTAPSSFKGWENTLVNPQCGQPVPQWQSKTGNTAPPPAGTLPRYLRVIVASNVGKAGSNPAGNVARIVIVDTQGNAYNPNPASNGAGKVVRVECTS